MIGKFLSVFPSTNSMSLPMGRSIMLRERMVAIGEHVRQAQCKLRRTIALWLILTLLSNCVIFYPLVQKSFEEGNIAGKSSLAALYILADKEAPTVGNGGLLQKLNPGNSAFTLSWTTATDDKTDSNNLQYRVYVSPTDNIRSVGEIEANGESLNSFTASLTSTEITSLQIRGTTSYYNVLVQDSLGKKSSYSSIAATIIPKYFYALTQTDNSISTYTIDKTNGTLTQTATLTSGNSSSSIYIPPRGNFLYQASTGDNTIRLHNLDPTTGALTFANSFTGGNGATSIISDPEGRYLYSADSFSNQLSLYKINSTDGTLLALPTVSVATGNYPNHLSIDPTGSFLYSTNRDSDSISQFVINYTTGDLTPLVIPTQATGDIPMQAAIDPKGLYAFVINKNGNSISNFKIDPLRGEWKRYEVLNTVVGLGAASIVFHPSGTYFYISESLDNQIREMSLDRTTGVLQPLATPTVAQTGSPTFILLDQGGKFLYSLNKTDNSVSLYLVGSDGILTHNTTYPTGNSPVFGIIYSTVE